jgi:hypothetical protein
MGLEGTTYRYTWLYYLVYIHDITLFINKYKQISRGTRRNQNISFVEEKIYRAGFSQVSKERNHMHPLCSQPFSDINLIN